MFAWLNLPQIRKELTALSESVAKVRAEIAAILIAAEQEKEEAVAYIKSEVAKATEDLTTRITELETKVEDLMTQPPGELDVSGIMEDLATLKTKVETFIVPDAVVPEAEAKPEAGLEAEVIPADGEFDEEEFDDVPTVIIAPIEPDPEA